MNHLLTETISRSITDDDIVVAYQWAQDSPDLQVWYVFGLFVRRVASRELPATPQAVESAKSILQAYVDDLFQTIGLK